MKEGVLQSKYLRLNNLLFLMGRFYWLMLCAIIISVFLSGCVQVSSLQTAKTLPVDEHTLGFSTSAYGANQTEFFGGDLGLAVFPHVEVFGRRGFAHRFDAGLKISSSANIAIDGKYQFLGDNETKFAMATGLALEYQFVPNFETFVSRQTFPVYLSFHPNDDFAVYTVPKFIHEWIRNDDNHIFLGNNLGLKKRINNRFSIIAEGSLFWVFDQQYSNSGDFIYQGGLGFVFDL